MGKRAVAPAALFGIALELTGCVGVLDDLAPSSDDRTPVGPSPSSASNVIARRLSQRELDRTLFDLLRDETEPARHILSEDEFAPYDNDYTIQRASRALIESLEQMATEVANRATSRNEVLTEIVPCTPTTSGDSACYRAFIESFGARVFRRPLQSEDVDAYMPLLAYATEDNTDVPHGFETAVNLAIRAFLQDPEFLYRIERGSPTSEPRVFALDDYEIATRMSYLLWGSTPDVALAETARSGQLQTASGRRTQAERMLALPAAREQLQRFHALWLGYRSIPHPAELVAAFNRETTALIDRVVFEEDSDYLELFTRTETFLDSTLARHYGLPAPPSGQPSWMPYPVESGRAGILSHGSVLAAFSKFTDTSPTQRGIFVRTRLMCSPIGSPPPTVNVDAPPGEGTDAVCKSDRYSLHRDSSSSCFGCHSQMDPIGFGLERFDVGGRYREVEASHPDCEIDGRGELPGVGEFSGPGELAHALAQEGEIDDCVVRQLWTFANGRPSTESEEAAVTRSIATFRASGRSLRSLLVAMIESPRFALRAEETR